MIKNVLRIFFGSILVVFSLFLGVACLFYQQTDASLNTAGGEIVHNWAGFVGAVSADLLWQLFGVMGVLFPVALCAWGVILICNISNHLRLRSYFFIPALLLGSWLGTVSIKTCTKCVAGVGGFVGFYLNQWIPAIPEGYQWIYAALWFVFGVLFIISVRMPVWKITKFVMKVFWRAVVWACRKVPALKSVAGALEKPVKAVAEKTEKVSTKAAKPVKTKKEIVPAKPVKKSSFILPSADLLEPAKTIGPTITKDAMERISRELEEVLGQFHVEGRVVNAKPGPVVTLYEFEPASGVKTSRVVSLSEDIARAMSALSVRIAVVPGSNTIGIEMPNKKRDTVYIRELVESDKFVGHTGALPLILGKDIGGVPTYADLAKMPHLLVAGTTGSGKSVAINTMILSLLYRFTPAECRLILVDPKMVELSVYDNIPHLLTPVVTSPGKAVVALKWAVREMEDRYRAMSQLGVRNIEGFNQKLIQAAKDGKRLTRRVQTGFNPETGTPIIEEQDFDLTPIPYIVMIVDEMSDLMGQCGKEAEPAILRLAQMARAVGIHLILATQRPSVDVITGLIKANFPTRISFQVTNKIDSRTILDEQGAEHLLGRGDMLYRPAGIKPMRLHGPFVSDEDVQKVVDHLKSQGVPHYVEAVTMDPDGDMSGGAEFGGVGGGAMPAGGGEESLYDQAVAIILRDKKVSISYVQRQLRIGYNKAADLIDRMEKEGVISKPNIAGKRDILVPTDNA